MSRQNQRIKEIISKDFGIKIESIEDDSVISELGLDSLDTVELIMALEEEFEIEIDDDEADPIAKPGSTSTMKDLYELVQNNV